MNVYYLLIFFVIYHLFHYLLLLFIFSFFFIVFIITPLLLQICWNWCFFIQERPLKEKVFSIIAKSNNNSFYSSFEFHEQSIYLILDARPDIQGRTVTRRSWVDVEITSSYQGRRVYLDASTVSVWEYPPGVIEPLANPANSTDTRF